jgi:2,3-bisphosphoglycerate-dependent phosphoglycerate mutase
MRFFILSNHYGSEGGRMTTIGMIRHGVTEWNQLGKSQGLTDIPLNEEGNQQAKSLAEHLDLEGGWDFIVTSDLKRAVQTAEHLAAKLKVPIQFYDPRIREIDCGQIEGTTEEERVKRWGKDWRELELGMEKPFDVAKRGIGFLDELSKMFTGKRILMVSHGALIGVTLQHLFPEQFPKTYIENTSLTILEKKEENWWCSRYNATDHLGAKPIQPESIIN